MKILDCIIIGGGPAGLLAATYLGRYRCNVKLIDNLESRARLITLSHNFPSYPEGISGNDILHLMRAQAKKYSDCIIQDTTQRISYDTKLNIFKVENINSQLYSKKIILATGVIDIEPKIPNLTSAIKNGFIRHCIICDGYEIINKKIALIAQGRKAVNEALFLNNYSKDLTMFTLKSPIKLTQREDILFKKNRIQIYSDEIKKVIVNKNTSITIQIRNEYYDFDSVYSGLGFIPRSELAIQLGARHVKDKRLITNATQETNIPGLYAIGDVVNSLSQMAVGMSHAAIAASAIFRSLRLKK